MSIVSGETLDQFNSMTDWFQYRIEENTLETLFSERYNSVIKMQSIAEEDLKDFQNINKVTRDQITMLRRFVGCLNCKKHPPVFPGAEGSGGGPISSSATSTAPSTTVLHAPETNPPEAHGTGPSAGNSENLQFM